MNESISSKLARLKTAKVTKSQKKLIDYLENADYRQIIYFTITEFARATGTGEATILRFCRALGFDGYQVFKLQLASEVSNGVGSDVGDFRDEISNDYNSAIAICRKNLSLKALDSVSNCILNSRRISCFGVGNSYVAALELHNRLLKMGVATSCERDAHIENILVSSYTPQDLMVVFSLSGSTKDVVDAVTVAKNYGCKVALITAHDVSPLSRMSDWVISTGVPDTYLDFNTLANKIVQLYVIDSLCESLHRKDKERFDECLLRSRGSTVGKLI